MEPVHYAILGYAVSIALLWGYALSLFLKSNTLRRMASARRFQENA